MSVWDVATHRRVQHFDGAGFVRALAFSSDNRRLTAAFQDVLLVCYDLAEGRELSRITDLRTQPLALSWRSDNLRLTVLGAEQSLCWDTSSELITKTNGLGKDIHRLALTPDAHWAVAARTPFDLTLLDLPSSSQIDAVKLPNAIRSLAISPSGQTIVTGDYGGNLDVRPASNLQENRQLKDHRGMIATETFSHDGSLLASGGVDQMIHLWNTTTWTLAGALRGPRSAVFTIAFSPDSRWLVSGEKSGEVKLWSLASNRSEAATSGSACGIVAPDGSVFAFGVTNAVSLTLPKDGRMREWAPKPLLKTVPAALSSNGFVLEEEQGHAFLLRPGQSGQRTELPPSLPNSFKVLSPDGRYYVYCAPGRGARVVWDTQEQRRACEITNVPSTGSAPAIAADNRHFAIGSTDGKVFVSDLRDGRALAQFQAHRGWCYACDFSRDGRQLVTAGFDGVVILWEAETGRKLAEFRSSADAYWSVALSPDGARIAAGTGESSLVLWDTSSRQEVAWLSIADSIFPVEGHLRFSPDGTVLMFGSPYHWGIWRAQKLPRDQG